MKIIIKSQSELPIYAQIMEQILKGEIFLEGITFREDPVT